MRSGDICSALEGGEQLDQPMLLQIGRRRGVKIAYQADADAIAAERSAWRRGRRGLVRPSLSNLHLAVVAAIPVADDEMIR